MYVLVQANNTQTWTMTVRFPWLVAGREGGELIGFLNYLSRHTSLSTLTSRENVSAV